MRLAFTSDTPHQQVGAAGQEDDGDVGAQSTRRVRESEAVRPAGAEFDLQQRNSHRRVRGQQLQRLGRATRCVHNEALSPQREGGGGTEQGMVLYQEEFVHGRPSANRPSPSATRTRPLGWHRRRFGELGDEVSSDAIRAQAEGTALLAQQSRDNAQAETGAAPKVEAGRQAWAVVLHL